MWVSAACEVKQFSKVVRGASGSFLWREGGDDFFEARIAAQRIPHRIQTQFAITWTARNFADSFKLLERQISLAHPGTKQGKGPCCAYLIWTRPEHCFLCGGHQFQGAPAFAQRLLLSSQNCIDLPKTKK